MGVRDRQTIGDGIEDGLDKMGDDHYRTGIAALDRVEKWLAKWDLAISLAGLDLPFLKKASLRIGLEPKE